MDLGVFLENYTGAFWAIWVIIFTVLLQAIIATAAHRRQKVYVPGMVDEALGHESFVFRSHRTFHNSMENLLLILAPAFVGILAGLDALWLASVLWVYAAARIAHMTLYYKIATERNPSPRSYFFMIGLIATLVLYIRLAIHLLA